MARKVSQQLPKRSYCLTQMSPTLVRVGIIPVGTLIQLSVVRPAGRGDGRSDGDGDSIRHYLSIFVAAWVATLW